MINWVIGASHLFGVDVARKSPNIKYQYQPDSGGIRSKLDGI